MQESQISVIDNNIFNQKTAKASALASGLIGVSYSLCFNGSNVYCQFSTLIFTLILIFFSIFILKSFNMINDKKGFLLLIPIIILALFNCLFSLTIMNYINIFTIYFLIISMCAVVSEESIEEKALLQNILGEIFCKLTKADEIFKVSLKNEKKELGKVLLKIFFGIFISSPIVLIITILLCSADRVFAKFFITFFDNLASNISIFSIISRIITFLFITLYVSGIFYSIKSRHKPEILIIKFNGDGIVLNTFLLMINLLFLTFCYIQFAFVFCGGFMKLPAGIIYSEYVRSGFFQLLFVTLINFFCTLTIITMFKRSVINGFLKIQLIALCMFTGVLIISSFYRMSLYIGSYGYTPLRNQVLCFLVMESFMVIYTIFAIIKNRSLIKIFKVYLISFILVIIGANFFANNIFIAKLNADKIIENKIAYDDFSYDCVPIIEMLYKSEKTDKHTKTEALNQLKYYSDNKEDYLNKNWQNYKLIDTINKSILQKY